MTLETFEKLIADIKADTERDTALQNLGVLELGANELKWTITKTLGVEVFGKDGWGWIEWFCWESQFGERKDMTAFNNDKPICYDVPSLYMWVATQDWRKKLEG